MSKASKQVADVGGIHEAAVESVEANTIADNIPKTLFTCQSGHDSQGYVDMVYRISGSLVLSGVPGASGTRRMDFC